MNTPPPDLGTRPVAGGLGRLGRLIRKELSEILRDRRTILTLVLMPLLLYPLLSIAFQQFFLAAGLGAPKEADYRLGFRSGPEAQLFLQEAQKGAEALAARLPPKEVPPQVRPRIQAPFLAEAQEGGLERLEDALKKNAIDLIVQVRDADLRPAQRPAPDGRFPRRFSHDTALDCEVTYLKESARSREALTYVEGLVAAANAAYLQQRLHVRATQEPAVLVRVFPEAVSDEEQGGLVSLSALVPLILILMTITGAVYPAIDLTAGERERGTLEILVAAPVPRLMLLFAKYVSVVTVAVLTALVNLVTMIVTVLLSGLGQVLFRDHGLTPLLVVEIFGLLLLFAAFFSAVLLILTSFARSFKEAQAYLIPLTLASLGPGVMGMLPGLRLGGVLTVTPLLNIVLLARDLLNADARPGPALIVVCSTLLYAAVAIAGAARIFGAEGVLYNEQSSWADLFRRPSAPQPVPTLTSALMCLALMFPTYFVLQGLVTHLPLQGLDRVTQAAVRVVLVTAVSVLLFGGFPLAAAALGRVSLRSGMLLIPAAWPAYLGGLVLGLSLWPLVLELLALQRDLGLATLSEAQARQVLAALRELRLELPAWLLIAATALPAPFEELLFRGYLFSALRARLNGWTTVLLCAVFFGLFHVLLTSAFAFDRLLPSTLLGLVLGWVCWRTGSVVPGMLLHTCHNAVLQTVPYLLSEAGEETAGAADAGYLPAPWLVAAVLGVAVGVALILWARAFPRTPAAKGKSGGV